MLKLSSCWPITNS